jgi:hypothetical protein
MKNAWIERPAALFDRETEWNDLSGFASGPEGSASIGMVYGRRRQGKSFMLEHLRQAVGGFGFQALEETRVAALTSLFGATATFAGFPAAPGSRFETWSSAFETLARAANGRLIVIDEFPYLLKDSGELPSVIQKAYDAAHVGQHPWFRLILCGSALSVMTQLLTGTKALRGRAKLDMSVSSFDFRQARAFWKIKDRTVAFLVNAVLGGPPGYRDLLDGAAPIRVDEFEEWMTAGLLNPSHALFNEADYLLTEDPSMTNRALYRSIIGSIAGGKATKSGLGQELGREEGLLDFALGQLERAHFIVRDHDLLRPNRPLLRVVDPVLRFYFAVLRRDLPRFSARMTHEAWVDAKTRFDSQVVGPHFESMARTWTARYASEDTLGGSARRVGFVQVNDSDLKQTFELDVAVEGERIDDKPALLAIGEAKGGDSVRTLDDLRRMDRLRNLLMSRADVANAKLLLFGRSGFAPDVLDAARTRKDVELIDLERLYEGS